MDTNQDALLSPAELGAPAEPTGGCPAGKSTLPGIGDLFLMGMALMVLGAVSSRLRGV
jgi:hypothetical protein